MAFLVSLVGLTTWLSAYVWPSLLVSVPVSLLVAGAVAVAVAVALRRRGEAAGGKRAESGVSRRY